MDHSFQGSGRSSGEYYRSCDDDYGNHSRGDSGSRHRPARGEGERDTYSKAANFLATIMTMIGDGPDTDRGSGYARERSPQSGYNYRESYDSSPTAGSRQSIGYGDPFSRPRRPAGGPDRYDYDEPPRRQRHSPQGYGGGYDDDWGGGNEFPQPGFVSSRHGYRGHAAPATTRGFRGRGDSLRNFRGQGDGPGFGGRWGRRGVPYVRGFRGPRPGQRGRPFDRFDGDYRDRASRWRGSAAGGYKGKNAVPPMRETAARKRDGGDVPGTSQKPEKPRDSAGAGSGSKPTVTDQPAATGNEKDAVKRKLSPPPASSGKKARDEESGGTAEPEIKKSRPASQKSTTPPSSTGLKQGFPFFHKSQQSCSLCRFRTSDPNELELHMQSKLHQESLRHLQADNPNDPNITKIINEFIKLRSQKTTTYNKLQSSDVKTKSTKDGERRLELDDSMEPMEVVHCHACNAILANIASRVHEHMNSDEHKTKRKAFNSVRMHSVWSISRSIMNNGFNLKILSVLKEKFQKETSAAESSSSTLKETSEKVAAADDKTAVDKKTTGEKSAAAKAMLKTSGKKAGATQAQSPNVTSSKPKAKVVATQKVAVKKADSLATEKGDVSTGEDEENINDEELKLEMGDEVYQVGEPEDLENDDETLNEAEEEWFVNDEELLEKAKESDLLQDEEQFLKLCKEAPEEVDRDSLDEETYLEVDTLADDHDTSFGDNEEKESKKEANDDDIITTELDGDAVPAATKVTAETSGNGSEKTLTCPPVVADATATPAFSAPSACSEPPRDAPSPPAVKAEAGKPVKGVTTAAGRARKAVAAAKTTPKPAAGNAMESGRVKAVRGAVGAVKVVATKLMPAGKKKAVKKPVVKIVQAVGKIVLPLGDTAVEMVEAAGGMLNPASQKVALVPASQPAATTYVKEKASGAPGSQTQVIAEGSQEEEDKGDVAMALPEVVLVEAVGRPERREVVAKTPTVRGRGTRGRSKRGKRKAV